MVAAGRGNRGSPHRDKWSSPECIDLDGDGLIDCIVGNSRRVDWWKNEGTASHPLLVEQRDEENFFSKFNSGIQSHSSVGESGFTYSGMTSRLQTNGVSCADIDGDGHKVSAGRFWW